MDPERLIHSGSDDEAALLHSAVREGPSPASRARTFAALGIATGVIAAATTTTAAAAAAGGQLACGSSLAGTGLASIAPGFASIAKWLGIGIASTAVVVGGAYQARESLHDAGYLSNGPDQVVEANVVEANKVHASGPEAPKPIAADASASADDSAEAATDEPLQAEEAPVEEATVATMPLAESPVAKKAIDSKVLHKSAESASPAPIAKLVEAKSKTTPATLAVPQVLPGTSSLAAEVASLDAARAALASGEAESAHAMLEAHDGQFKTGALGPEAQVLAIEVLAQSGQYEKAIARAEAFLAANPASPHRARVQSVAASCRTSLANASP